MSFTFQLTHFEEEYAPPEEYVLDVTVVGTVVFLDICEYDESDKHRTLNKVAGISVDGEALTTGLSASALEFDRSLKRAQKRNAARDDIRRRTPYVNKGYSEETCTRCGWRMGSPPLNCQNNNTPHVFPSQIEKAERVVKNLEVEIPLHECDDGCGIVED